MERFSAGWWLKVVLRADGLLCASAVLAVVMPCAWMSAAHEWLGFGALPGIPVVDYLARTTSAFYAMHGALEIYASLDVRRHANIVWFLGVSSIALGLCLLGIDVHAGLPWYWTPVEGPGIAFLGVLLLILLKRDRAAQAQQ